MFDVKVDAGRNCIILTLEGQITAEEIKKATNIIIQKGYYLGRGFNLISNISNSNPVSTDVIDLIMYLQQRLFKMGVAKVIRVLGNAFLTGMQFSRLQKEARADYKIIHVDNMAQAYKAVS